MNDMDNIVIAVYMSKPIYIYVNVTSMRACVRAFVCWPFEIIAQSYSLLSRKTILSSNFNRLFESSPPRMQIEFLQWIQWIRRTHAIRL